MPAGLASPMSGISSFFGSAGSAVRGTCVYHRKSRCSRGPRLQWMITSAAEVLTSSISPRNGAGRG
jgi:hypothetical protein